MTTTVLERVTAKCPYHLAKTYLHERYNAIADGKQTVSFALHGAGIQKDVIATFKHGTDAMHFDEPWEVEWKPAGGGPFPSFRGRLTVRADYDYKNALLELEGRYQPPLGVAGEAFDAIAGRRIASHTARYLLTEIATELEERYARQEASKPV